MYEELLNSVFTHYL